MARQTRARQVTIDALFVQRKRTRRDLPKAAKSTKTSPPVKDAPVTLDLPCKDRRPLATPAPVEIDPLHHAVEFIGSCSSDRDLITALHRDGIDSVPESLVGRVRTQLEKCGTSLSTVGAMCGACDRQSALATICTHCRGTDVYIGRDQLPFQFVGVSRELIQGRTASAALRGLDAALRLLLNEANKATASFDTHGGDALFLFRFLAQRASDERVRVTALQLLKRVMARWDERHPSLSLRKGKHAHHHVLCFAEAVHAKLFLCDPATLPDLRDQLREALAGFRLQELIAFVPGQLLYLPDGVCGNCLKKNNLKKSTLCASCSREISPAIDYQSMFFALVWSGLFRNLDVDLKASDHCCRVEDILHHMGSLRPYRSVDDIGHSSFMGQAYFVTHLIFVMSDWGAHRLDPSLFAEEVVFIISNIETAIRLGDPELVGEFIHSLRILGASDADYAVRRGVGYLLQKERSLKGKGSWVKPNRPFYQVYHSIYCAIIGLVEIDCHPVAALPDPSWRRHFL